MYHVYEKTTGLYAGSGITEINTDDYASTTVEPPTVEPVTPTVTWDGEAWQVA